MSDLVMDRSADLSDCGAYRYSLSRKWGGDAYRPIVFVMLNPSTADASVDDPTIRRCMSFAQRESRTGILVVNLFAFRATSPTDMMESRDPIGADNDLVLSNAFFQAALTDAPVVAAWGAHGSYRARDREVYELALARAIKLQCFGRTKSGAPRHPLYLKSDTPLVEWQPSP